MVFAYSAACPRSQKSAQMKGKGVGEYHSLCGKVLVCVQSRVSRRTAETSGWSAATRQKRRAETS